MSLATAAVAVSVWPSCAVPLITGVVSVGAMSVTVPMAVLVEVVHASVDRAQLQMDLERRFKEVVGVRLIVEVVERGKTDEYTGTSRTSKIKRLLDRRVSA